jgi:tripartite ATP-independent transporter DctM subunit
MGSATAPVIMMILLMLGIVSGLPFFLVLGGVAVVSTMLFWGFNALPQMVFQSYKVLEDFVFVAIPLYVLMAMILHKARLIEDMFDMIYKWSGPLRGGLAIGTEIICAVFAACTGIAGGTETTMGLVALPAMRKYKYDLKLSIGTVLTGGTLGQLIPPSVLMVIYGLVANVSVGKQFAGGVATGLVLVGLYISYILIRCFWNKNLAPALPPEERASWREKFLSLKQVILPLILVLMVLGSVFTGIATPTEAAGMGVAGALFSAFVLGRLNWELIQEATTITMRVSAVIGWIVVAASAFTNVFIIGGGEDFMRALLTQIPGGKWGVLLSTQIILLGLGMILDTVAMVLICAPLFNSIVISLGFDPVWFALLFMVQMQIAYISPPFGYSLFYLYSVVPKDVTMDDLYRAAWPFIGIQVLGLAIFIIWPNTVLWLPNLLFK